MMHERERWQLILTRLRDRGIVRVADLVGVTRQTAILAYQLGELTTPMIPTSGITVGVLALARIPWITWAKWMIPLQLIYAVLALAVLVPPCLMNWQ